MHIKPPKSLQNMNVAAFILIKASLPLQQVCVNKLLNAASLSWLFLDQIQELFFLRTILKVWKSLHSVFSILINPIRPTAKTLQQLQFCTNAT